MTAFERSLLYFSVATLIAIALGLLCPLVQAAMAAEIVAGGAAPTVVTIPWGDWLTAAAPDIAALVLAAALWLVRQIPGEVGALLRTKRVEQLLDRSIGYGINAVAGAAHGRTLSLDVGSAVLAEAVDYAIEHAPRLVAWAGEDHLAEKIWARLRLDESVGKTAMEALQHLRTDVPAGNGIPVTAVGDASPSVFSSPSGASPAGDGRHPA